MGRPDNIQLRARIINLTGFVLLGAGSLIILFPFWEMLVGSLKTSQELYSTAPTLFPKSPQWENYTELFGTLPVGRLLFNSIFISATVTVLVLITSSLAGYALAKYTFKGRSIMFKGILSTILFPQFLFLIPVYFILKSVPLAGGNDLLGQGGMGVLNSYFSLIVPFAVSGFGIFYMRQYMLMLPDTLIDAARIDGCSELRIFRTIILPLSKPALVTLAVFTFVAQWNEYIWTVTVTTSSPELMTMPVGIQMLRGGFDITRFEALMRAALVIAIVPTVVLFILLQKYYVRSMHFTGIKE
jgi:multiple sugar transport system permease protein